MIARPSQASPPHTERPTSRRHAGVSRWARVLLILITAGIVSGIAGLLSHEAGNNIPAAILTGGGAFAGTVGVLLAIAHYAGEK
jgi:ABC-type uncharacterized transport system permease subunit